MNLKPTGLTPDLLPRLRAKRASKNLRLTKSEGDLNFDTQAVALRANFIKLPRLDNEHVPLPNSFFQRHHAGASVIIGRAPERPQQQTFDAKFIVMLRNFFIEAAADGTAMAQRKAFAAAMAQPEYRTMGEIVYEDILGPGGHPSFGALLRRYYPSATKAEMTDMIRVAFPRPRRGDQVRSVSSEERKELTQLFNMFDEDRSNSISLREFLAATKAMNMVKADQVFWMYACDTNGDGELGLEEWIRGMHNCYF